MDPSWVIKQHEILQEIWWNLDLDPDPEKNCVTRPLGLHDLEFLNLQRLREFYLPMEKHIRKHTLIYINYVLSNIFQMQIYSKSWTFPDLQIFEVSPWNHPRSKKFLVRPTKSVSPSVRPDAVSAFGQRSERWPDGVTIMSWMSCFN